MNIDIVQLSNNTLVQHKAIEGVIFLRQDVKNLGGSVHIHLHKHKYIFQNICTCIHCSIDQNTCKSKEHEAIYNFGCFSHTKYRNFILIT